jgi:hypothetical protein
MVEFNSRDFNCTFSHSVDTDGNGGYLIIHAFNGSDSRKLERIVSLTEEEGTYNPSV